MVIAGTANSLSEDMFYKVGRYRHKVFIEMLGWDLKARNQLEFDQFDRPDTLYMVSQNESGEVNGCARLLPTNRPYLLGEVFPELMNGMPVPCSSDVWELSRVGAVSVSFGRCTAAAARSHPVRGPSRRKAPHHRVADRYRTAAAFHRRACAPRRAADDH